MKRSLFFFILKCFVDYQVKIVPTEIIKTCPNQRNTMRCDDTKYFDFWGVNKFSYKNYALEPPDSDFRTILSQSCGQSLNI